MEMESCVPPGFRFHPTEEELVGYYLNRKINSLKIDLDVIIDIDLYKIEPWDIQDRCKLGYDEQKEWYFFSHKDKKYPTGTRTNRATAAGFWKATGRDKAVLSNNRMIGMRKTLVFYKGRAPNGRKTDWIMHEYRIQTSQLAPTQEEGWVVCRAFKKPTPNQNQRFEAWAHPRYHMREFTKNFKPPSYTDIASASNTLHLNPNHATSLPFSSFVSDEDNSNYNYPPQNVEFPDLDSPSFSTNFATSDGENHKQIGNFTHDQFCEDSQRRDLGGSNDRWNNLDELLMEPASFQSNFELNSQSHLFTHLPDF